MARAKHKTKRASGVCLLLHLPLSVLQRIFTTSVVTPANFLICKALLPATLGALYHNAHIHSRRTLVNFAAALTRNPHCLEHVHVLEVDFADEPRRDVPLEEGPDEGLVEDLVRAKAGRRAAAFEPNRWKATPAVFRTLVHALKHLSSLDITGSPLFRALMSLDSTHKTWPVHFGALFIDFIEDDDLTASDKAAAFCRLFTDFPSMEALFIGMWGSTTLPLTLLNLSPSTTLPARSSHLRHVEIKHARWLGPELRHLTAALGSSLTALALCSLSAHPRLNDDLDVLPTSLVNLRIELGPTCPVAPSSSRPPIPHLDPSVLVRLPNLSHLHLSGNVLLPPDLLRLRALPRLVSLTLGEHVALAAEPLAAWVFADTYAAPGDRVSPLAFLTLNVCVCPPWSSDALARHRQRQRGDASLRARWPAKLPREKAGDVVRAARKAGIVVDGSLVCALKMCDEEDGHECATFEEDEEEGGEDGKKGAKAEETKRPKKQRGRVQEGGAESVALDFPG
ncbi:hypothetical protein JCM10207_007541 [Rhodosporidiobolus poonsookiae]